MSASGTSTTAARAATLAASVLTYSFALGATLGVPLLLLILIPAFELTFYDINSPLLESFLIYFAGLLVATNPILTVIATRSCSWRRTRSSSSMYI